MSTQLEIIQDDVYGSRDAFVAVQVDRSINFDREAGFAVQLLTASEYAMKIATGNRQSVVNAVTNVAAIGISLNPAKRQAYLVPRDGKICLDISYMGLMDLAIESGSLRWAQADVVRETDIFTLQGFDRAPTHSFNPFAKDRGEVIGVYVVVKTIDGEYLTTTMTTDEVNAIRDRSVAWKAWVSKKSSCPWVTDWAEMAKKTCVKRAYKYWPKTDRLDTAIHHLNADSGEGLAVLEHAPSKRADVLAAIPEDSPERDKLIADLLAVADNGTDAFRTVWKELAKESRAMVADKMAAFKERCGKSDTPDQEKAA